MKRSLTLSLVLILSALANNPVFAQYYPNPYYPHRPVYPQGYHYPGAHPQSSQFYIPGGYSHQRPVHLPANLPTQTKQPTIRLTSHTLPAQSENAYNKLPADKTGPAAATNPPAVTPALQKNTDTQLAIPVETVSPDVDIPSIKQEDVTSTSTQDTGDQDTVALPEKVAGKDAPISTTGVIVENCAVPHDVCCEEPERGICFSIFGEVNYFTVRGVDLPFGQGFNGVTPLAVQRSSIGVADPNYDIGFRVGGAVALNECSWIQATYSWFQTNTHSRLDAPAGTSVRAFLTFPNTMNTSPTSLFATADYGFRYHIGDVEYKRTFCAGPCHELNWLVGLRYAHLDQELATAYQILGTTTVDSDINFDGVGPRAGIDGLCRAHCGLFGYGKGFVNLLAGHFNANYEQNNTFTGLQGQTEFGDDRIVPVLEMELGVGWMSPSGHVRVSAGYFLGTWFNMVTTPGLAQTIQGGTFASNGQNFITQNDDLEDTLSFDGLVGRFEFRY